jgi:putative flippase GtrA
MTRFAHLLTGAVDRFYFHPLRRMIPLQTFRYAACGGLNMGMDALLYYVVFHFLLGECNVDFGLFVLSAKMAALVIVFPVTFFNGFWLNRNVAFKQSPLRSRTQIFRYMLSVGGAIILTAMFMKFFTDVYGIWPVPSKVITTVLTAIYSYLMQKYFTFRGSVQV